MKQPALSVRQFSRRHFLKYAVTGTVAMYTAALATSSAAWAAGTKGGNMLILYFSRSGNTRAVAEQIHGRIGGQMIELKTVVPYPADYDALVEQAQREQKSNARPRIATEIWKNMILYSLVFPTGGEPCPCRFSPCWKNTMSATEASFLSVPMKAAVSDAAGGISRRFALVRGCLRVLKRAAQEPPARKKMWTPGCAGSAC